MLIGYNVNNFYTYIRLSFNKQRYLFKPEKRMFLALEYKINREKKLMRQNAKYSAMFKSRVLCVFHKNRCCEKNFTRMALALFFTKDYIKKSF